MLEWIGHLSAVAQGSILTGVIALPGAAMTYVLGIRSQRENAEDRFNTRVMATVEQRDRKIAEQDARLERVLQAQIDMSERLGQSLARVFALEDRMREYDRHEREMVAEISNFKTQNVKYEGCSGGAPCPFRAGGQP